MTGDSIIYRGVEINIVKQHDAEKYQCDFFGRDCGIPKRVKMNYHKFGFVSSGRMFTEICDSRDKAIQQAKDKIDRLI